MRVEIRERPEIWLSACRAEIATVMFGRIGKVLLFSPDGIKRFCASLAPFVHGGIFVMLFKGILVDEGAVAGVAGDAHGWSQVAGSSVMLKRRRINGLGTLRRLEILSFILCRSCARRINRGL